MNLSVVIPAYNEERDIERAVIEVHKALPKAEIVVVNDSSTDKTYELLRKLRNRIPNLVLHTNTKNRGHGFTVIYGLWHAKGDNILYIDSDRQIDVENFKRIPAENLQLYDVISGYRVHRNDKLFRKITSLGLKLTILLRHKYYIKDANCPFKIYRREAVRALIPKLPKTLIIPIADLEVMARRESMLVGYIDTAHKPYVGTREGFLQIPNMKFFKFVGSAFKEIVKL